MTTYEGQCRARFRAESGPRVLPPPYPPLPEGSLNPEPRMARERFSRRENAWWGDVQMWGAGGRHLARGWSSSSEAADTPAWPAVLPSRATLLFSVPVSLFLLCLLIYFIFRFHIQVKSCGISLSDLFH